jgi:hypothetical protein
MAITALVLGIVSVVMWCPALPIAALVIGKKELNAISRGESSQAGQTFAKVGFVLGIAFTIIQGLFWLVYGAFIILAIVGSIAGAAAH